MAVTLTKDYQLLAQTNLGSFGYGTLYLREYGKYDSQSTGNNTTTYTLKLAIYCDGYYCYSGNCYAYISGTCVQNNTGLTFPTNGEITLGTKTSTVAHNSDGTRYVEEGGSFSCYAGTNGNVNAGFNLPTIPRASTIACTTANIGETAIITIDRKSSSFTHTIQYLFGDLSGTIVTKTSNTTISWTIPTNFYTKIPNNKTGRGTLTCYTFDANGNTVGGTTSVDFTVTVNTENNKPIVSISAVDTGLTLPTGVTTTSLTGSNKRLINNWSSVKVTATATAKNSATIKSTTTKCGDGQTSTSLTPTFTKVHGKVYTVTATDSRGISNSASTSDLTLVEYTEIQTTKLVLKRISQTSGTVKLSIEGKYFNGNFGNVNNDITLKYRCREINAGWSEYITLPLTKSNGTFSYNNDSLLTGLSYQMAYVFEIILTDKVNVYTTTSYAITKGIPVFDYGENDFRVNGRLKANTYFSGIINPAAWFYVGRFSMGSQGAYAILDCYTGNGQNGNAFQNTHARILLKQGYIGDSLPIGITTKFTQNYYPHIKVKIKHLSLTECDLYIYLPFSYNDLTYTINGSYKKFDVKNSLIWEEPETDKESIYYNSCVPIILYENATGNTGTVTLNQTAADFRYMEIYYKRYANTDVWGNHFSKSVKIDSPNGKNATLDIAIPAEDTLTQVCTKIVSISGTTITVKREGYGTIADGSTSIAGTQNAIYITKVIGYK